MARAPKVDRSQHPLFWTEDALKREFREEMDLEVSVGSLFYINDFLQLSQFIKTDQLLSVYYEVATSDMDRVEECILNPVSEQSFRWVDFESFNIRDITFPIDKVVFEKINKENRG